MSLRTLITSDLSGKRIDETDAATLIVRFRDQRRNEYVLDVSEQEAEQLARKGRGRPRRGRRPKHPA